MPYEQSQRSLFNRCHNLTLQHQDHQLPLLLPSNTPKEQGTLWNSVEQIEKMNSSLFSEHIAY